MQAYFNIYKETAVSKSKNVPHIAVCKYQQPYWWFICAPKHTRHNNASKLHVWKVVGVIHVESNFLYSDGVQRVKH
jgi:hypothetical protein